MCDHDDRGGDDESTVDSQTYYAPVLSSHDILDRYYHKITRIIRPHLFYSWLREKQVFTRDDQEEVENRFITTVLKAGHLVDIIKTKGTLGFIAFVEVVEFEYPELFSMMTSLEPRVPPKNFFPKRINSTIKRPITDTGVILKLAQEIIVNKERFAQLQQLFEQMQLERRQESEENQALSDELRDVRENLELLQFEKDKLSAELSEVKTERDRLSNECAELRNQKDNYMDKCNRLRRSFKGGNELNGSQDSKPADHRLAAYRQQLQQLRAQLDACRSSAHNSNAHVEGPVEEVDLLRSEIGKWEQKEQLWSDERVSLTDKISQFENELQLCHETSDLCLTSVEDLKKERNQILKQLDDFKSKYEDQLSKTDQLSSECRHYIDKFRRMDDAMQNLYREIEQQHREKDLLKHENDQLKLLRMCKCYRQVYATHRPLPMCSTVLNRMNKEDTLSENTSTDGATGRELVRCVSQAADTLAKTSAVLKTSASQPELSQRSRAAVPPPQTNQSTLIALFAPIDMLQDLMDKLKDSFETCNYVTVTPTDSGNIDTIHEILSPDDSTCRLLTVDELKLRVFQQLTSTVVIAVPASSIKAINQQGIKVIILTVKASDSRPVTVTEEEDDLVAMCSPEGNQYETLEISADTINDVVQTAQAVEDRIRKIRTKNI